MASDSPKADGATRALSAIFIVVGAGCLGLALSGWNYIQWVHNRGYKVDSSTTKEVITELAIGVVSCAVGLLLWFFGKRPAI